MCCCNVSPLCTLLWARNWMHCFCFNCKIAWVCIFQITQCIHHLCLVNFLFLIIDCQGHKSLNFGPILKFWCLNIPAFQDLSFSFAEQPCGTCPRGQKRVLKLVHENKNQKIWKKWTSRSHSTDFFLQVNWKVYRLLKFEIWGLSDFAEKSYECLFC